MNRFGSVWGSTVLSDPAILLLCVQLEVQYFHDHASVAGAVALKHSPTVDLSATVGAHGIAFGAEAGFDTSSGTFTKYNAGLSLKKPDYIVSILL